MKDDLNTGATYLEKIVEITTSGEYRYASDGTKITIEQGEIKTYIYYIKQ